jgi:hypothetical protein
MEDDSQIYQWQHSDASGYPNTCRYSDRLRALDQRHEIQNNLYPVRF